jgi:ATP-dependent Clp protease ATP-binding subunit ClpA
MIDETSRFHSFAPAGEYECNGLIAAIILRGKPTSRIRVRIVAMFDEYSTRAKQVLFLARLESGARGAEMLDLDDLLTGLIIEDQNVIPSALSKLGMEGQFMDSSEHHAFLPRDTATNLLENIHQSHPRSQPIPHSTDMPISSDLGEVFAAASELRKELHSKEVTPLHLLAVTMRRSHSGIQALRDKGITEEAVLSAIRKEDLG